MVLGSFDEKEVEHVIQLKKWINQAVEWKEEDGYLKFKVKVECEEIYPLQLICVLTQKTGYYRYNLLLGSQPIRMLHIGKKHHNPDCASIGSRHKHRWTDFHNEHWAYEPNNIDFTNMETSFMDFLKECIIEFKGHFIKPSIQMRLFQ